MAVLAAETRAASLRVKRSPGASGNGTVIPGIVWYWGCRMTQQLAGQSKARRAADQANTLSRFWS